MSIIITLSVRATNVFKSICKTRYKIEGNYVYMIECILILCFSHLLTYLLSITILCININNY